MEEDDNSPFDEDGNVDYHKWLARNAFLKKLHDEFYMEQLRAMHVEQRAWLARRDEMLCDLAIIDEVIEMMDEYPEAEYLINKITRRLDNDKKY